MRLSTFAPILALTAGLTLTGCGGLNRTPPGNYSPSYASSASQGPGTVRCDDANGSFTIPCMLRIGGRAY
ncbi:hypothetical protein ACFSM5_17190 [Lacibacterium aquatile]|uniref:Lipoprotein n=1 Tax=Lacibacterium aquatile TaxID=1168082 RepID=A0ABW5DU18_9PROT